MSTPISPRGEDNDRTQELRRPALTSDDYGQAPQSSQGPQAGDDVAGQRPVAPAYDEPARAGEHSTGYAETMSQPAVSAYDGADGPVYPTGEYAAAPPEPAYGGDPGAGQQAVAPPEPRRHYSAIVPALLAALATGGLWVLGAWAFKERKGAGNQVWRDLTASVYPRLTEGKIQHGYYTAAIAGAVAAGVVVLVLLLTCGATARRAGARGLLWLAGWGATLPATVAGLLVAAFVAGHIGGEVDTVAVQVMHRAGTWALMTGWLVGLVAALSRFGRARSADRPR